MSSLIRKIDFQKEPLGKYSFEQIKKTWIGVFGSVGVEEGRCKIVIDTETKKKCLRVDYVKNKVGPKDGGAAWRMHLGKSYDEIYIQFKVKFPKGFNFVLGGKLPGIGGGSLPVGGQVADESGFTVRIMWRAEDEGKKGRIVQYVYYLDKDPKHKCGQDMHWKNKEKNLYFKHGKWQTLKTRVKMNTIGKKDGIIQSWLNGKLALNEKIRFRLDNKLGTDTIIFTTFFGGNIEEWAPKKEEYVLFDEFIVSNEDIR